MSKPVNALRGMECPSCGHVDDFTIAVRCRMLVTDEGASDIQGAVEWDEDSDCVCGGCGYRHTVSKFKREDGDE